MSPVSIDGRPHFLFTHAATSATVVIATAPFSFRVIGNSVPREWVAVAVSPTPVRIPKEYSFFQNFLKQQYYSPIWVVGARLRTRNQGEKNMMKRLTFAAFALFVTAGCLTAELRIGTADAMKAATSKVQPQYPAIARQMKVAGHVEIEALVDSNGSVASARAVSGNPMLTQPAIAAVEKWKFTPFTSNGESTKAVVTLAFDFRP
jgi:protein TonB